MKRFLSIFAIMALVVSMFSGVAFAATETEALAVLNLYAVDEAANPAPTIQTYTDAGLERVVTTSLSAYNTAVVAETGIADKAAAQAIVDAVNLAVVNAYVTGDDATDLTIQELLDAGATAAKVVTNNLKAYKAEIEDLVNSATFADAAAIDTFLGDADGSTNPSVNKDVVDALDNVKTQLENDTPALTQAILDAAYVVDYDHANRLAFYNVRAKNIDDDSLDTLAKVQAFVDEADAVDCELVLDSHDTINLSNGGSYTVITGKIIDVDSGALVKGNNTIHVYEDSNTNGKWALSEITPLITAQKASNGVFEITIPTHLVGQYFVVADNDDSNGVAFFVNDDPIAPDTNLRYDTFRILPKMELSDPETLEWDYEVDGQQIVRGVFVNEDCNLKTTDVFDPTLLYIDYIGSYDAPSKTLYSASAYTLTANFLNDESFGFLFNGNMFTTTGDVGIYYDGILLMSGEVKAGELEVSVTDKVTNDLGEQELTFDFNLSVGSSGYAEESGDDVNLKGTYKITYVIEDEDDNVIATGIADDGEILGVTPGRTFDDAGKQLVKKSIDFTTWEVGKYTVEVKLIESATSTVVEEATVSFNVVRPSSYNLMNWSLEEDKVGKITFSFDEGNTTADQLVVVRKDMESDGLYKYVEVVAEGCGVDDTFATQDYAGTDDGVIDFEIEPTETGTLELTINVYKDENDGSPEKTFKQDVTIKGWNVEITPNKLTVGTEEDVTFTVTDEEGNPVNNAIIKIGDTYLVNGNKSNIVGGVYTYEDDDEDLFTSVGDKEVIFYNIDKDGNEAPQVTLDDGIVVVGEEVYTVSSDMPILVNGFEDDVYITVLDEDGNVVYPTFERINISSTGKETSDGEVTPGSRKDIDEDGVKEAVKLVITPSPSQVEMIIRATTDSGKKMGEVKLEVQKPSVVMTGVETLTENFDKTVEFQVVDPRDNSVIDKEVYFKAGDEYISFTMSATDDTPIDVDADNVSALVSSEDDVFTCNVFVEDVNWELLDKDEEDAEVTIMLSVDADPDNNIKLLDIPIGKASLTSDPDTIIMNTGTSLTLTYVDAEEKPLEGYDIDLSDDEIGETDENGQVTYSTAATSSVALTFEADTDDKAKNNGEGDDAAKNDVTTSDDDDSLVTTKKVKAGADVLAPTASYELSGNTAIITIKDNVRIAKAMVNGELVDMFFPMPTATHVVSGLKTGVNTVEVLAGDVNNNFLQVTLEITVEATVEPVSFTLNEDTEYGKPVKVEATTMVPVRFAQDLGATVEWDDATQTVTYTKGETTISMTVGSKTAVVNGENVQLPVAPFKNDVGRTMVPVRMIATELGFTVNYVSDDAPITIE
jgi:hypothetical protein